MHGLEVGLELVEQRGAVVAGFLERRTGRAEDDETPEAVEAEKRNGAAKKAKKKRAKGKKGSAAPIVLEGGDLAAVGEAPDAAAG